MSTYEEKRRHPRGGVEWPTEIMATGRTIAGEMKNISASGAYVQCSPLPKAGEIVSAILRPPRHKPIEITAEVIWTSSTPPFGMGIAFTAICDEDRWFISETVSASRPASGKPPS